MDRILTGRGMKSVDTYTIQKVGIPSMVLMERAALEVSRFIEKKINRQQRILCICGTGNNGADAIAVARQLVCVGYQADIVIVGDEAKASEEFIAQKNIAISCNVKFLQTVTSVDSGAYNSLYSALQTDYTLLVDGIFGIGLSRNIEGLIGKVIEDIDDIKKNRTISGNGLLIVAVDIPSGLNSNTGEVMGCAIKADYTVTFGKKKAGMYLYMGKDMCGRIEVCNIGFPEIAYENALEDEQFYHIIENEDVRKYLPRTAHSNKGSYGKVLIIAGSNGMYGAAYLAASAALRIGAGLVRIVTHKDNRELIYKMLPEVMIDTYDTIGDLSNISLEESIKWADSVLIGPGISTGDIAVELVKITVSMAKKYDKYLIIDADGLNIIAKNDFLKDNFYNKVIITPHIGEASRLMNLDSHMIAKDIVKVARDYSDKYNINVVLKDSTSVILGIESFEDKCNNRAYVNTIGNAGMATAGSGDVLAGIIAGVMAGGLDRELVCKDMTKAIAIGVYIHSLAGDMAAEETGQTSMLATDILDMIAKVLCTL